MVFAARQDDITLDQVLVSVNPQGCLRELVGAELAPCFYRQTWFWDGSKRRECSGVSEYQYATLTGSGNPQTAACPSPGVALGYMESYSALTIAATGQFGEEGRNVGKLANLNVIEDCASTTGITTDQTCQMTLAGKCTLVYEVKGGLLGDASGFITNQTFPSSTSSSTGRRSTNSTPGTTTSGATVGRVLDEVLLIMSMFAIALVSAMLM